MTRACDLLRKRKISESQTMVVHPKSSTELIRPPQPEHRAHSQRPAKANRCSWPSRPKHCPSGHPGRDDLEHSAGDEWWMWISWNFHNRFTKKSKQHAQAWNLALVGTCWLMSGSWNHLPSLHDLSHHYRPAIQRDPFLHRGCVSDIWLVTTISK